MSTITLNIEMERLEKINAWLKTIILLHAFFAFFLGVFFLAWGDSLSSPPWRIPLMIPGGATTWGALLICSGTLFLLGLSWRAGGPRMVASAVSGLTYFSIGICLLVAPFVQPNSLNAGCGMWMFGGLVSMALAGLMHSLPTMKGTR